MKKLILRWILAAVAIMLVAWIIPGISITGFKSAMGVVIVMALVNSVIKPVVKFISLPLNILTLGIFGVIVNALLFMLVAKFAPGFQIDGFWSALFGAGLTGIILPWFQKLTGEDEKKEDK